METKPEQVAYARLWQRWVAAAIDSSINKRMSEFISFYWTKKILPCNPYYFLPARLFGLFYHVYLVKHFGGTLGKLILKTKIERLDGRPMNYRTAFIRYSVPLAFEVLLMVGWISACMEIPGDGPASLDILNDTQLISFAADNVIGRNPHSLFSRSKIENWREAIIKRII